MPLREQTEERLAGDLCHGVPHRHVQRSHRHRTLAVPTRLFVGHHRSPDAVRVEVLATCVEQRFWFGLTEPRREALADQSSLAVAPVRIESVADDALAIALDIGHDRDQARRHLRKIDIRVADRRRDGFGDFTHVDDAD